LTKKVPVWVFPAIATSIVVDFSLGGMGFFFNYECNVSYFLKVTSRSKKTNAG